MSKKKSFFLDTFILKMGQIGSPETWVLSYLKPSNDPMMEEFISTAIEA
jgi:hypothetical protein